MEFEDVRCYQSGDDVRNIDWRVTARTTITHTKTFTEERERPVFILCDQRGGMFFGSRRRYKSVQAANISALLAWSALARQDRIGGLIIGTRSIEEFPARSRNRAALQFLAGLNTLNQQLNQQAISAVNQPSLSEALADLRRVAKTGAAIFIISDFHDLDSEALHQLFDLGRHNSLLAFDVYDPIERALPQQGHYGVSRGEQLVSLDTSRAANRQRFADVASARNDALRSQLARYGIPLTEIATNDCALSSLSRLFQRSGKRVRHA